jgi:signal transduction histidine kinase
MNKLFKISKSSGAEAIMLVALLVLVGLVLLAGWGGAMKLRQTVAANAAVMNVDTSALTEVEHLRNLADSQIQNSRAYFLMGSKSIFDKQRADKDQFNALLADYEKKHSLPQVHAIVKHIEELNKQDADYFQQAMDFRDKNTESKIVGQFYQSKSAPILSQLNDNLDKIIAVHNADLVEARARAHQAGLDAQAEIPKGMIPFSAAIAILALCFALLIVNQLRVRARLVRERDRLVTEAKNAILSRDEVFSAFTQDFKEPLAALTAIADHLKENPSASSDDADLVKSTVIEMEALMADISDQTKASVGGLFLRLEQLGIPDILDEAQTFLQPLAKQRDITLQFDAVNQSILAYVDRERVMRVLANLVGNAIKFSPKHSRVNVKIKSDAQFVNISVLDSGPQIPSGQLSKIFDNFWQARKTSEQGAGVGLTVVKTIIEAHGGTVKVEHNLQNGNTFTFSLSRRRPANAQLKKPQTSGVRRIARETPAATTAPSETPDGLSH